MRLLGRRVNGMLLAFWGSTWFLYVCLELRHWYDTAVRVPPVQRVARERPEVRLPRIFFCPADRGRQKGFRWHSFECLLKYREEQRNCLGRERRYRGREPDEFLADGDKPGDGEGSSCLEFSTHMVGVKQEWSAAWNEIHLRAAFVPGNALGVGNALQEVELGYEPEEWERGMKQSTMTMYYQPLERVPFFYLNTTAAAADPGVAVRMFLATETDRDLMTAGKYWYTYSAMQIAIVNASLPGQEIMDPRAPLPPRLAVVHVVITLEDFKEFSFQVVSAFFPLLQLIGRVAGCGALLAWMLLPPHGRSSSGRRSAKADGEEDNDLPDSPGGASTGAGAEYDRVTTRDHEEDYFDDDENGESQALLGGLGDSSPMRPSRGGNEAASRRAESRKRDEASEALLGTEGVDGL